MPVASIWTVDPASIVDPSRSWRVRRGQCGKMQARPGRFRTAARAPPPSSSSWISIRDQMVRILILTRCERMQWGHGLWLSRLEVGTASRALVVLPGRPGVADRTRVCWSRGAQPGHRVSLVVWSHPRVYRWAICVTRPQTLRSGLSGPGHHRPGMGSDPSTGAAAVGLLGLSTGADPSGPFVRRGSGHPDHSSTGTPVGDPRDPSTDVAVGLVVGQVCPRSGC